MKNLLKLEELAIMIGSFYLMSLLNIHFAWWLYPILFLSPDISMVFYAAGKQAGAIGYNLFHHKAVAISIAVIGFLTLQPYVTFAGLILLSHSSFDRTMGYGLKYFKGFKHTHLGDMK
ncbi:MAG: DUF4260 family protein [Sphingobacteriales bacterium]|nr:MAG: DUF4260 family protein [Sphingobacteriales bacterium]